MRFTAFGVNGGWRSLDSLPRRSEWAGFNPRTPAKSLMGMMTVMTPNKVKDVRELTNVVEKWDVKNLNLGPRKKVELFTAMFLAEFQNYVFQWSEWEVHVRRDGVLDRLHGAQQGVNEEACSNGGGQKW